MLYDKRAAYVMNATTDCWPSGVIFHAHAFCNVQPYVNIEPIIHLLPLSSDDLFSQIC